MGNKPKTQPQNERRQKVEALKRQQKAAERRKTMTVVGGAVLVAGALIAVPTVKIISDNKKSDVALSSIGVGAAAAQCGDTKVDKTSGGQDHVDGHVDYTTIPPSSGKHNGNPVTVTDRGFFTTKDAPPVEELVHNLEHGYTVLWYDPAMDPTAVDYVETLAKRLRDDNKYRKFVASPWDKTRGGFPNGKFVALSHWGAKEGFRQYCGLVSGEAVQQFMDAHPASDSPEPNTV